MEAASSMMNYVVEKLREKEKEMGAESVVNYAVEKSKELPAVVGNMGGDLMGAAAEKWKELPAVAGNLMDKVDEVFPPETRREQLQHLIQVSKPYIIPVAVLLIVLYCCGGVFIMMVTALLRCFGRGAASGGKLVVNMVTFFLRCFGRGFSGGGKLVVKMMKAPGRSNMMPRHVFESNPGGYFRGLRGK